MLIWASREEKTLTTNPFNPFNPSNRTTRFVTARRLRVGTLGFVLALSVGSGLALAVDDGAAAAGAHVAVGQLGAEFQVDPILSAHLARSALLDLALHQIPTPDDYQLASLLLSIASDLEPGDADLARTVVEAAWAAGELELMLDATRRVIKADPQDTVAQLRLVSSIINTRQTVEERLKLYDRFLGASGKTLDESVRSRLALDAALLEREVGNNEGFAQRLLLSTKLDISNKSAASLSAQFYSEVTNNPISLLDYQFKLLFADPLDANVHLTIARIFAREGAFVPARRFLLNSQRLYKMESGRAPSMIEEIRLALNWQLDGPRKVLDDLNPVLEDRRAEAQAKIDAYIEAELPTDDLLRPEEILYELGVDKLRLLAAYHLGDIEVTEQVLDDIQSTVNGEINSIGSVMGQRGVDQSALLMRLVNSFADFQVMRAISELEPDEIRSDIETLVEAVPVLEPYFLSIEPMALYADGEFFQSIELARKYPSSPMLELIKGLSYEKLDNIPQAIEIYSGLVRQFSLEAYGAFAQSRLERLGVGDRTLSSAGVEMIQMAETIPNWIDQMISRPSFFMYLDMSISSVLIDPMEPAMVTIRLKNMSPIPLGVGPAQPIDSRFVLLTRIDHESMGFEGMPVPKVIGLDHRLRLRPLEEIVVTIPADSPGTQWIMKMQPNASIRQRYRLLQGPRPRTPDAVLSQITPDADAAVFGIINSTLGLTAETGLIQRLVLEESKYSVDELVEAFGSDDEMVRRRAVVASAGRLVLPANGVELSKQDSSTLVGGLMDLYTRALSAERGRMILLLPQRHQVPAMMAFDDHVVSLILSDALIDSRVDTVVFAAALLTRTDASDSPIFEVLEQAIDPRLHTIAGIIRARLDSFTTTLGTVGPGVDSMNPPKDRIGF